MARIFTADVPITYRGVKIPETLKPNWDQPEAFWWRKGVDDTMTRYGILDHTEERP